jgi:adenosylcobinamide kinase/adenosylcobinamide-phosphate guanylyltransferase
MFIFVTGGYRSGRSNYALRRAAELGPPPWLYVTAGEEETAEAVRQRIERHRRDKEAIWQTAMAPSDLGSMLRLERIDRYGAVVLDGFIGWLAARIASIEPTGDAALITELEGLAELFYRSRVPILLVSQEIGLGLPPG